MNKIDIFNANAEFFERFNNSLEDTANDRHERTRFTVTGLENKVEFAITNAQGRIKKAEEDAVDRLNKVNGMTNDELISKSVGAGKWMREGAYGLGGRRDLRPKGVDGLKPSNFSDTGVSSGLFRPSDLSVSGVGTGNILSISNFGNFSAHATHAHISLTSAGMFFGTSLVGVDQWTTHEALSSKNTRTDKNNVLHSGTDTPINTLNVSDMAQDVVNRDDVTVTSGAVYRALANLRTEIALLKGNTDE